jgi:4-amino-4-deoxy-L-arabinose transferase-like glycosyltransferase
LTQRERSIKSALVLGLLVGLGLLTKQSAVIFAPLIVSLVALEAFKGRISWRSAAQQLFGTLGLAGLIYLPWAIRNWQVYHTFMPENLVVTQIPWPSAMHGIASAVHNLLKTFWSVSGLSNDVGYPFPVVGMLLLVVPVLMFALDSKPVETTAALNVAENKSLLIAMLVAVLIAVGLVLRFGFQFGMGQGRHLFPLLCPIALFLAAWLRRLSVKTLEVHAAGFWITYAASFAVFSVCRFPR